jgi:para-nitrobenzyl esterase
MVPTIIGATDRDLALGVANSKDQLFAIFGTAASAARNIYDPSGDQTLDELKQQVFADRLMAEPARHFANEMARAGQPVWLYRFSYVAESERGTVQGASHGLELPYVFDLPAAIVGDKVTPADKAMAEITSAYWVAFARTGNPNGGNRPQWPRHDPDVNRIFNFTNAGVTVGPDLLKPRLDLWRQYWQMQVESSSADRTADRKVRKGKR